MYTSISNMVGIEPGLTTNPGWIYRSLEAVLMDRNCDDKAIKYEFGEFSWQKSCAICIGVNDV